MPPFVPNGVYTIRNVEFSHNVAGLIQGTMGGPILGFIDRPGNPSAWWRIRNVGSGGNEIIIENVFARGNFAGGDQFPGAQLSSSPDPKVWTIVQQDRGYHLQSPNAEFVWQLTRDGDFAQIVLIPFTAQDNTKWTFDPVGN
ncbi:hypothetical protein L210DRAFT_3652378 [Boletus edulis BED1]|uniref:Ricin B lectin domain-containing protein n=1 Tax=Boletus edulis BED1 TaxID=1328754 RepID=A0AAD4G7W3_BOLED|nr:hypothetical protein L210DRAFT_3652378 [Boletus edulis BED1]